MKRKKNIFFCIIILFFSLIIIVSVVYNAKNHMPIVETNSSKIESLIKNKEDALLYIGRPTCPECNKLEPILKETLNEAKANILYLNTDEARIDNEDKMLTLLDSLSVKVVPTIIKIKNGQIDDSLIGYHDKVDLKKFILNVK